MMGLIVPVLNILLIFVLDSNYVFSENQLPDNEAELVFSSIVSKYQSYEWKLKNNNYQVLRKLMIQK